jgi:hypothetical protein
MSKQTWGAWAKGLFAGCIGGGANAVVASLGLAGAEAMGAGVQALNFKQMMGVFIAGSVISLMLYLKQSPLPKDE